MICIYDLFWESSFTERTEEGPGFCVFGIGVPQAFELPPNPLLLESTIVVEGTV